MIRETCLVKRGDMRLERYDRGVLLTTHSTVVPRTRLYIAKLS